MSEPLYDEQMKRHVNKVYNDFKDHPAFMPLSKVLGLEIETDEDDVARGFRYAVEQLDQLSPDVEELAKILWHEFHLNKMSSDLGVRLTAQEIINSMPQWIKKG